MFDSENFKANLFFTNEHDFEEKALELFGYQWHNNEVYQKFCQNLNKSPHNVQSIFDIPFLPIEFFKTDRVTTGDWEPEKTFLSSGTTGMERSKHYVKSVSFYHQVAERIFNQAFGPIEEFTVLALLPSYLEQGDSSLISMVDHFIKKSNGRSCFVKDVGMLPALLEKLKTKKLLLGVSYALLDLADADVRTHFSDCIIMETGGMKGRRKEIVREELHSLLKWSMKVTDIYSEYGMTELLSQAYGKNGLFSFPAWARALIRDINDPLTYIDTGKTGGINVIDLANVDSCAFVETKDLGKLAKTGFFEVLGRFDNSDIRGCNLMV